MRYSVFQDLLTVYLLLYPRKTSLMQDSLDEKAEEVDSREKDRRCI